MITDWLRFIGMIFYAPLRGMREVRDRGGLLPAFICAYLSQLLYLFAVQWLKDALARGDRIELRGFGVFVVKPRKRGIGRNPRTGEEVAIPSGKTIRFKPGKELQAHEDGLADT